MIELPKAVIKAETKNPRRLFIFSNPKTGKTSLVSTLPDCLIVDLENGTDFIDGMKIKIENVTELGELARTIKAANIAKGGYVYKYIVIDTVTALEDLVKPLALKRYKETPMGKSFTGTSILTLPNGAGYGYLRDAFEDVYKAFDNLSECLILLGHLKKASITKDGKEVTAKDIDLTGKLKNITAADMDAIGFLTRKGNQNILSFKTTEEDLATGARPAHLRNKELVISELKDDDTLVTHWDKIFLPS